MLKNMGASFRNIEQIKALAGLDKLTISPKLIEELTNDKEINFQKINITECQSQIKEITADIFKQELKDNEMANFKLKEGIDKFIKDTESLENIIN
jgi:transaldolase